MIKLAYIIILVIGFWLLADYTISNTNKQIVNGSPFDGSPFDNPPDDIDLPGDDEAPPDLDLPGDDESGDDESGGDDGDDGSDDNDHGCTADEKWNEETELCDDKGEESDDESNDDESGKEDCEDEPGFKWINGECKPPESTDDENDNEEGNGDEDEKEENQISIVFDSGSPGKTKFIPDEITVTPGTTLSWTNEDTRIHTVVDKGGAFDSSIIAPGNTWDHTFNEPGEFEYESTIDGSPGKIIVAPEELRNSGNDDENNNDDNENVEKLVSIRPGSSNPNNLLTYQPSELTIKPGTTVTWKNDDSTIHTVVDKKGAFDSGIISPNSSFENTFDTEGNFNYGCSLHPWMKGKVIVSSGKSTNSGDRDDNDNDSGRNDRVMIIPLPPQPQPQPQPQSQILIPKPNTPPTAMNSSVVTTQNRSINIPLEIYDKEGDMLDISIPEAPKFGNLAIKDINTKTLTYTPNSNYIGYDSFIFQGNDRKVSSNNATVSITVANLPPQPTSSNNTSNSSLTFSTPATSQAGGANQPSANAPATSTNTQDLNNLNQAQLVDLIATKISNTNSVDKNKLVQAVNDLSESTKSKGGNVIESLKEIAGIVLNDPTGNAANTIINAANRK